MVKKIAAVALAIVAFSLGVRLVLPQQSTVPTPENFLLRDRPVELPALEFADGEGHPRALADFRGKVVLLNVWATWCLPCRKEMPTLDRLEAALGSDDFMVLPLSIDRGGAERVKKFYDEIGVQHLGIYVDSSRTANNALGVLGLPATLLIDRQGRELGRLSGAAEWDAPETIAFLKSIIAKKESRLADPQRKGRLS
jgi:thiol-disulfide isomerase/thioredoxin